MPNTTKMHDGYQVMLSPNEIEYLTQRQDNGIELSPEAIKILMQADEPQDVPEGKEKDNELTYY